MLARRFGIICLLCMIMGFGLSMLIEGAARPSHSSGAANAYPCVFDAPGRCSPPKRY